MKKLICLALLLSACTSVQTAPTVPATPAQSAKPTVPAPQPTEPVTPPVKVALDFDKILKNNPNCVNYSFKNRGKAPYGFMKGVAMAYAKSLCRYNSPDKTPAGVMGKDLGDDANDALAHYDLKADKGGQRIKQVYTLLLGLGMRESSGFYGEGRDASANNVAADTAETGLFQFSYNLHTANPMLNVLQNEYMANKQNCNLDTFKQGITRTPKSDFYGSGPGLEFQKFARTCPAFATEYTAVGVRVLRKHWGPINRKEAEYLPACEQMLSQIEVALTCQ
jgi:hypothetical protein